MACSTCNSNTGCSCNPCTVCPTEAVDCETLPSALDNFIKAFFGTVEKTLVDGSVVWTLPCDLDIGLPSNPRGDTEGLACYFLRLFLDGITGLTGPNGETGDAGSAGANAYTVTTSAFTTPTLLSPSAQFTIIPSAAVKAGLSIFVPGAGWFVVTEVVEETTVFATLIELSPGSIATIPAATLVLPTGPRGLTIVGPIGLTGAKGDPGIQGPTGATGAVGGVGPVGPAGAVATNANQHVGGATVDYALTMSYSKVDFAAADPEVVLAVAGTYLLLANISFSCATPGSDELLFKLFDGTAGTDVPNSEVVYEIETGSVNPRQVVLMAIYTIAAAPKTVQIYAQNVDAVRGDVHAARTSIIYVKLS